MPKYFFHASDGAGFCEDPEGVECADDREALAEAEQRALSMSQGKMLSSSLPAVFIEVEDATTKHLFTVTVDEVIAISESGRRIDGELASA